MARMVKKIIAAVDFMTFVDLVRYTNFSESYNASAEEVEEIRNTFING